MIERKNEMDDEGLVCTQTFGCIRTKGFEKIFLIILAYAAISSKSK